MESNDTYAPVNTGRVAGLIARAATGIDRVDMFCGSTLAAIWSAMIITFVCGVVGTRSLAMLWLVMAGVFSGVMLLAAAARVQVRRVHREMLDIVRDITSGLAEAAELGDREVTDKLRTLHRHALQLNKAITATDRDTVKMQAAVEKAQARRLGTAALEEDLALLAAARADILAQAADVRRAARQHRQVLASRRQLGAIRQASTRAGDKALTAARRRADTLTGRAVTAALAQEAEVDAACASEGVTRALAALPAMPATTR